MYNLTAGALLFVGMTLITMGANSDYEYKQNEFNFSIFLQIQGTVCVLLATTTPLLHALFHCCAGEKTILLARIIRNIAELLLFLEIVAYLMLLLFNTVIVMIIYTLNSSKLFAMK